MARPRVDNSRDYDLHIRMNDDEMYMLDHICECTVMTKSDVIRCLIEGCYRRIMLEDN